MKKKFSLFFLRIFISYFTFFLLGFGVCFIIKDNFQFGMGKNENSSQLMVSDTDIKHVDTKKLDSVYNFIRENYYDFEDVEEEKLIDSMIGGLVEGLGDKHSQYFTPKENSSFSESLDQEFEGIGAVVEKDVLGVKLDRIFKGSSAKKYGLFQGDIIVSADNKDLSNLSLEEAISYIKGPAGSRVELKIYREGEKDLLIKEVIRNKVEIPSVEIERLSGNIGYIALSTFGEKSNQEFAKALIELKDTQGIILDLRGNGGGYLTASVEILSRFIEPGKTLVVTKGKGEKVEQVLKSIDYGHIYTGKLVVLIDENSASASEIVAGALKDYNKAILVGTRTYGKGSVQLPFDLGDDSMLKLTIAKWFTPNDKNIDGEGITPDILIEFKKEDYILENCKLSGRCSADITETDFEFYDRQKEEAKKILDLYIEKKALQLSIDEYMDNN